MFVLPFFTRISSKFGPRNIAVKGASKYHKGIDIAAPSGTPVFAAKKGVITVKNKKGGYGNVVYISHPDGTETRYGHLSGFTDIVPGMEIEAGTQIGFVGSTGVSSGPHLHFEMRVNGQAVDPSFILNEATPEGGFYGSGNNVSEKWGNITPPLSDWDKIRAKLKEEDDREKNTISFAYRTAQKEEESSSLFGAFSSGNIFSGLLKSLVGNSPLLSSLLNFGNKETEESAAVTLKLSKKDMRENGFTEDEINKIATLSQQKTAHLSTLADAGQIISSNDLRDLGLDEIKVRQFDALANQKQNLL